jgi:hypothetical protein
MFGVVTTFGYRVLRTTSLTWLATEPSRRDILPKASQRLGLSPDHAGTAEPRASVNLRVVRALPAEKAALRR